MSGHCPLRLHGGLTMESVCRRVAGVVAAVRAAHRIRGRHAALLLVLLHLPLAVRVEAADSVQIPALKSSIAHKALLTDSAQLSDRVVAVGSNGVIVYSLDGEHWIQAEVPSQVLLTTVFFIDDREGWAAGHDTLILHTTDGGESWQIQYEEPITDDDLPKPILDLHFDDRRRGWAIGAFSLMLATEDGGRTWQKVDTGDLYDLLEGLDQEPEPNFNAFHRLEDGFLIVGELGTLLHYRIADPAPAAASPVDTGDSGTAPALPAELAGDPAQPEASPETSPEEAGPADTAGPWTVIPSPYAGSFFGVNRLSSGEILIYGLRGHLFKATDLDGNWQAVDTGGRTENINDVIELDDGTSVAVGTGGTLFHLSRNAAKAELIPYPGFEGFVSAQKLGARQLLLFGDAGARVFPLP